MNIFWPISLFLNLCIPFAISQPYQPDVPVPNPRGPTRYFCDESLLQIPYIKYYEGRTGAINSGRPARSYGPGFHADFADPSFDNMYLCVNGLVWLYYSVTTKTATVYQTPELHHFVHHCFMVNGLPGPGPHSSFTRLLAILLMGNSHDYGRPSVQMFSAPFIDPKLTDPEYNATSLFVIGTNQECILSKETTPPVDLRVRTELIKTPAKEGTPIQTQFCKLSYKNLAGNLKNPDSVETAKQFLKNDLPISVKACGTPINFTETVKTYAEKMVAFFTGIATDPTWGVLYTKLIDPVVYLKANDVDDDNAKADLQVCEASPTVCTEAKIRADLVAPLAKVKAEKDPEAKKKLRLKEVLPIALKNWQYRVALTIKALTTAVAKAKEFYEKVVKTLDDALTKQTDLEDPAKDPLLTFLKAKQEAEDAYEKGGKRDPHFDTEYIKARAAVYAAEVAYTDLMQQAQEEFSQAESWNQTVSALFQKGFLERAYRDYVRQYNRGATGAEIPLVTDAAPPIPITETLIIKATAALIKGGDKKKPTMYELDPAAAKTCAKLPLPTTTCQDALPNEKRRCEILKARVGNLKGGTGEWKSEDAWREDVLDVVGEIFLNLATPGTLVNPHVYFAEVRKMIKAYFTNIITSTPPYANLPSRRDHWDQIMILLGSCRDRKIRLHFDTFRNHGSVYLLKRERGKTIKLPVHENVEQADDEFSFNWVVDQLWFVFTSVLGACMPAYKLSVPLISSRFFSYYTEDFLYPLTQEWVSNRDNPIFRLLFGEWYRSQWPKRLMEASFVHSRDITYRPPRKLYVNELTEGNFFIRGPLAGTPSIYD